MYNFTFLLFYLLNIRVQFLLTSAIITDQFYLDSKQIVGLPLLHDGKETQIYFKLLHRRKELLTAAEEKLLPMILQYYKKKIIK